MSAHSRCRNVVAPVRATSDECVDIVVLLLVLGSAFGLVGLLVETLEWMLVVAVSMAVAALVESSALLRGRDR